MTIELKVIKPPEDISDAKDGSQLLATVEIFGASHHLTMMRVIRDEENAQLPWDKRSEEVYYDLQGVYSGNYETFEIPGYSGDYIAYMHPFDD